MFKCLVFQRTALTSGAIADLQVIKASINEDLTQKATSNITCLFIPTNVQQYDIVRLYDTKGQFVYWGVINGITDNTIKCSQFQALYNDNFLIKEATSQTDKDFYANNSIAYVLANFLGKRHQGYISNGIDLIDQDVKNNYLGISTNIIDTASERLPFPTENKVVNLENYIYEIFNNYSRIIVPIWVNVSNDLLATEDTQNLITTDKGDNIRVRKPLSPSNQHIMVGVYNPIGNLSAYGVNLNYNYKTLFDTYENISNLNIVKQDVDVNTIYIYRKDGSALRGACCATNDGTIQSISSGYVVPNRLGTNKTKYIFDDDNDMIKLARNSMPTTQYNHKITFDITFNEKNRFDDYILAQKIKFYENANNRLFDTLLTARKFEIEQNSDTINKAQFTLGKTRTNLTSLINKNGK